MKGIVFWVLGIVFVLIIGMVVILMPATPNCAWEGEQFSKVYENYPSECCKGLTEWESGLDTRISIAGECYKSEMLAGSAVGTCINCGNGACEKVEDVCNCPEDCAGVFENSDYFGFEGFCEDYEEECRSEPMKDFEICKPCQSFFRDKY